MTFDARRYWNDRLESRWSLGGTGQWQYSAAYNRWLYRAKRDALRRAIADLQPGEALDVGSGVGWVIRELLRAGWSVSGCDIAPVAVEKLRHDFPGVEMSLVDVAQNALPRPDGSVGLVTALDVAYHVVDEDGWAHFLQEVRRILRSDGSFVVSDTFGAADQTPAEHVRFRSRAAWDAAAASAGLRVAHLHPYFRLLSRPPEASRLRRLPDGARGAIEYVADRVLPLQPWMRLAVLRPVP